MYIWKDVGYESLVDYTGAWLCYNVKGWTEDQILEKLDKIEYIENYEKYYKAPPVEHPRNHSSKAVVLPPTPIAVGGGWHCNNEPALTPEATASWPAKQPIDTADMVMIKQMCVADLNNTDTESESDEEPVVVSVGLCPPPPPPGAPAIHAGPLQLPIVTLTHQATSTTVPETLLEGQTTGSPSLGGPSVSCFSPLPQLIIPINLPHRPVHACLQTQVMVRDYLQDLAVENLGEDMEMNLVPETQEETQEEMQQAQALPITYAGYWSHISPPDDTSVPCTPPPTRANSPPPAQRQPHQPCAPPNSVLAHLERAQMVDAVHNMIRTSCAEAMSRSHIRCAEPSAPLKTTTQGSSSAAGTSGKKSSCRLKPVAAVRTYMVEFNKRCAHDNATSFPKGWCALWEGEEWFEHELLPDNKEDLAHDKAMWQGKQLTGGRKKKPLARNFTGIQRQILTLAKVHLFTFTLSEGIHQTCATFMMWAALVHEVTWLMELPNVPYIAATTAELEVMVNYLAALCGKIKEHQDIQDNLDLFHELHPNSFHCTSTQPRRDHYKHIDVAHCIAAAFFYSPNAVGVLFLDYFEDMPLTVITFVPAIMQFCIEEWSEGYFTSWDLGATNMLDKYEAHLAGLKDLRKVAPRHVQCLQEGWFEYALEYSGACFMHEKPGQEGMPHEELRPDTPPPLPCHSLSQGSAEGSSCSGTSIHTLTPTSNHIKDDDLYEDPSPNYTSNSFVDDQCTSIPHDIESCAPTPLPAAEYNEHGCQTAHSKGKGCACD